MNWGLRTRPPFLYNISMDYNGTRITRPLSDKTQTVPDAIEDEEIVSTRDKRLSVENKNLVDTCRLLLSGCEQKPVPDYGWIHPVEDLCYAIEKLNYEYRKYGLRVVLDQSKEKYGTLRFYTHTELKEIGILGLIDRPIDWIVEKLRKLNFGPKTVVDKKAYSTVEWHEISKEQFDERLDENENSLTRFGRNVEVAKTKDSVHPEDHSDNMSFLVEEDGRYFYSSKLHHLAESHVEWTRHRFLGWVMKQLIWVSSFLSRFYKEPKVQTVMINELDRHVDKLVEEATDACYKRCQHCGTMFFSDDEYDDKHPRCETQGWYMYLCEDCAIASGMHYRKCGKKFNGKIFKEGVEVESDENGV